MLRLVLVKVFYLQPVADNNTEEKKTSVGDDESKRWRKGRGAAHKVEERAQVCYGYILERWDKTSNCRESVFKVQCLYAYGT